MVKTNFRQIKCGATRSGKCPVCGKRVRRSTTFTQTVSPFNVIEKNGHRRPKTFAEVEAAVNAEAAAWKPDFTHEHCTGMPDA